MTPQEIIRALKISMDDPPPWDGEIHEVQANIFGYRVRVMEVNDGLITVQMIIDDTNGETILTKCDLLMEIVLVY
jgi:hypothetical protein